MKCHAAFAFLQIEEERKRLEREKAAFEAERKKFAIRTAALASSASQLRKADGPLVPTPPTTPSPGVTSAAIRAGAVTSPTAPSPPAGSAPMRLLKRHTRPAEPGRGPAPALRRNSFQYSSPSGCTCDGAPALADDCPVHQRRGSSESEDSDEELQQEPGRAHRPRTSVHPGRRASMPSAAAADVSPPYGSESDPWGPVRQAKARPRTAPAAKDRMADTHDSPDMEHLRQYTRALQDPRNGIPLSNKRIRLTTYRQCFSGAEGAGWFMANMEGITSTEAAAKVGQQLLDLGVIVPVKGSTVYVVSDQNLYQFRKPDRQPVPPGSAAASGSIAGRPQSSSSLMSARSGSIASFSTAFSGESPDEDLLDDASEASNPLHIAAAKVSPANNNNNKRNEKDDGDDDT